MLKEFLNSISGPLSNVAFTYPSGNGVGGPSVGPQGIFNKLLSALSNGSNGGGQLGYLNGYTTMQGQNASTAAQAYANSLNGGQDFNALTQHNNLQQAFSPGSIVNTLQAPPSPQAFPGGYSQVAQLATIGNNPLQGFAGAAGAGVPGTLPGAGIGTAGLAGGGIGAAGLTGLINPLGNGSGGFGKISMFLMPLVGLVSVVRSLIGFRGLRNSMQPVSIDKEAIDYKISLENYQTQQHTEGSFDDDYWGEEEYKSNNFDESKLEM